MKGRAWRGNLRSMQEQSTQNPASSSNPQTSVPVQSNQNSNLQPQSTLQAPVSSSPQQDILNNPNQKTVTVQDANGAKPAVASVKSQTGLTIFIIVAALLFGAAVWRLLSRFDKKKPQYRVTKVAPAEPVGIIAEQASSSESKPLPIMRSSTLNAPIHKKKKKKYNVRKHR